jgi:hypothetical protein
VSQPLFNPWAAPILNGFTNPSPEGCDDVDYAYIYPESGGESPDGDFALFAGNEARLGLSIILDQTDAFIWNALQWALFEEPQQGFLYRVQDDQGNWISDGYLLTGNTAGTFANPCPIFPHVGYGRNHRLVFDLINASNSAQGIQFVFRGSKRYQRKGR